MFAVQPILMANSKGPALPPDLQLVCAAKGWNRLAMFDACPAARA